MMMRKSIPIFCAALFLAGCGQVFNLGGKDNESVYQLEYPRAQAVDAFGRLALFVDEPIVRAGLNTDAIMVQMADNELTRMKGVRWAGRTGGQVRAFLVDQLRAEQAIAAHGVGKLEVRAGCRLLIDLDAFEIDAGANPDEISIQLRVALINSLNGDLVGERSFAYGEPLASKTTVAVVQGFTDGMVDVGGQIGAWITDNQSGCAIQ